MAAPRRMGRTGATSARASSAHAARRRRMRRVVLLAEVSLLSYSSPTIHRRASAPGTKHRHPSNRRAEDCQPARSPAAAPAVRIAIAPTWMLGTGTGALLEREARRPRSLRRRRRRRLIPLAGCHICPARMWRLSRQQLGDAQSLHGNGSSSTTATTAAAASIATGFPPV